MAKAKKDEEMIVKESPKRQAPAGDKDLSIDQLREKYRQVVGRETESRHAAYLKWKIRQAEKGDVSQGSRTEPDIAYGDKRTP